MPCFSAVGEPEKQSKDFLTLSVVKQAFIYVAKKYTTICEPFVSDY